MSDNLGPRSCLKVGSRHTPPAIRVPGTIEPEVNGADHSLLGHCPDCGSGQLAFEEGRLNCHICGYAECG